uniref:Uncharacterized protein n=1 Tax=Romanomermis culicivorax TaxID=13658 RepID=A0A915KN73_ROMCU
MHKKKNTSKYKIIRETQTYANKVSHQIIRETHHSSYGGGQEPIYVAAPAPDISIVQQPSNRRRLILREESSARNNPSSLDMLSILADSDPFSIPTIVDRTRHRKITRYERTESNNDAGGSSLLGTRRLSPKDKQGILIQQSPLKKLYPFESYGSQHRPPFFGYPDLMKFQNKYQLAYFNLNDQ